MTLYERVLVIHSLLIRDGDSEAIKETTKWCFYDTVEALFILAKQGKICVEADGANGVRVKNDDDDVEDLIPHGLFSQEIENRIKIAA